MELPRFISRSRQEIGPSISFGNDARRPALNRVLNTFRFIRDRVPLVRWAYWPLREPYYRMLEWLFPRGIRVKLQAGDVVRLHPRFLVLKPEAYEPEQTHLLAEFVKPGSTVLDLGA